MQDCFSGCRACIDDSVIKIFFEYTVYKNIYWTVVSHVSFTAFLMHDYARRSSNGQVSALFLGV